MSCQRTEVEERLIEAAQAMVPILKERGKKTDGLRRVCDETIADFQAAGFFRMLQPKRWGGFEVHPNTFFEVQTIVASACPSSAWVLGVVTVHGWQLGLFEDRAQQDVWGDDSSVLISSSYAPTGKVKRVEGGFEISGRWSFSSGCDHCDWVFLGGFAPTDADAKGPDMRTFLLPKSDYTIDDNWHVCGLKGTGSKDIVVDGAFVPEHRTHRLIDGFKQDSPGNELNTSPLFRLPFGQIFVRSVSTSAIGIAAGALDFYREVTSTRIAASDQSKVAEDPVAQMNCARAASTIDEAKLVLHRNFHVMMDYCERGEKIPLEERIRFRWDSAHVVEKCVEAVDGLFTACGGRAIFLDSPMQRYFNDVHAARAHYANRPEASGRNLGRTMLGMKNQDFFI